MGYTLRVRGLSISCATIEELEKIIERYGEGADRSDRSVVVERFLEKRAENPAAREGGGDAASITTSTSRDGRTFHRVDILAAIASRSEPVRSPEVSDLLGATGSVERGRVSASIFSLAKIGLLIRSGEGVSTRYAIAEAGLEYLQKKQASKAPLGEADDESDDDAEEAEDEDGSHDDDPPDLAPDGVVPEGERKSGYRMAIRTDASHWLDEPAVVSDDTVAELRVPAVSRRSSEIPEGFTRDQWRSRRHRAVRAKSESMVRFGKVRLRLIGEEFPEDPSIDRPRVRADCAEVMRPCPYVGCRYNLFLDVSPKTGAVKYNFPDREPWDMPATGSCALDVADAHPGGLPLEGIGELMNLTRERTRQIEEEYWPRLTAGLEHLRRDLSA